MTKLFVPMRQRTYKKVKKGRRCIVLLKKVRLISGRGEE